MANLSKQIKSIGIAVAVSSSLLLGAFDASAEPEGTTAGEIALLPEFCRDKEWGGSYVPPERKAHWRGIMGQSWEGIHHYCWALVHVRRATGRAVSPDTRTYLLGVAISDYHYAIENSTKGFVLIPEMLLRMGEAHVLGGNYPAAISSFERSKLTNPLYWPAYQRLADVYLKVKLPLRAKGVLIEGLQALPGQPQLLGMFQQLGGRVSEIPPAPLKPIPTSQVESVPPAVQPPAPPASGAKP